jgi:hypothetical protein
MERSMLSNDCNKNQINKTIDEIIKTSYSLETWEDQKFIKEVANNMVSNLIENKPIFINDTIHHLLRKEYSLINDLVEAHQLSIPKELSHKSNAIFEMNESNMSIMDSLLDKIKKYRTSHLALPLPLASLSEFDQAKHKIEITLKAASIASKVCEQHNIHSINSPKLLLKKCEDTYQTLKEISPFIETKLKEDEKNKNNVLITPTIH